MMAAVRVTALKVNVYEQGPLVCICVCAISESVFLLTSVCGLLSEQMLLRNFCSVYRSVLAVSFIKCVPQSVSVL